MAQRNKAGKSLESIFPEITEEQTAAVDKMMEKQAEEYSAEIAKLQEQLNAANKQIKEFQSMNIDEIKASAAAWQEKYAASEKAWNEKLAALKYEAAAKDAVADIRFSSNSAKRAFLSDLQAKNLPLEDDKLTGFSDFLNSYKESDPDAFVPEPQNNGNPYLPGVSAGVNLGNTEEMDAAQKAFADRGIDFSSIKKFSTLTNRSVN
jgi:type I site-specific restriction endonuclease